jgi:hypothetical protein
MSRRIILIAVLVLIAAFGCTSALAATGDTLIVTQGFDGQPGASQDGAGSESDYPVVSADGRYVAFQSQATNIVNAVVAPDRGEIDSYGWEVYVRDMQTGTTVLASRADGTDGAAGADVWLQGFSADGRYVEFGAILNGGSWGFYRRDLQTDQTVQVNDPSVGGPVGESGGDISADGRYALFDADTYGTDPNVGHPGDDQIYMRDMVSGKTVMISRASGADGTPQDGWDLEPTGISPGGRYVAFETEADNLNNENSGQSEQLYLRDVRYGTTILVSRADGHNGATVGIDWTGPTAVTAGGCEVAFDTSGADVASGSPANGGIESYVRNICTGTTTLASRANGLSGAAANTTAPGTQPMYSTSVGGISVDGTEVSFTADASNLATGETSNVPETFVRNLVTGTTTLASRANGADGATDAGNRIQDTSNDLSANGLFVAWTSSGTGLVDEDTGGNDEIYERDLGGAPAATPSWVCGIADDPGIAPPAATACPAVLSPPGDTNQPPVVGPPAPSITTPAASAPGPKKPRLIPAPRLSQIRVSAKRLAARVSRPATVTVTIQARRLARNGGISWHIVGQDRTTIKWAGTVVVRLRRLPAGSYRLRIRATGQLGTRSGTLTRSLRVPGRRAKQR